MSNIHVFSDVNKPVSSNPADGYTMPTKLYTDPAVYELEKTAIFSKTWHYIGHESHVCNTGDYLTLDIADESVFIIRSDDDQLRGFFNVCRHRAHRLLEGAGNVHSIVCPYHAWSYRNDGSLRHARFSRDMPTFDPDDFCLPEIRVESVQGLLFVNLDLDAKSIDELAPGFKKDLGELIPHMSSLRPLDTFAFDSPESADWQANWKVVVDNYVECYHCAPAHPALADLMEMGSYEHKVQHRWARQIARKTRNENKAYTFGESDDVQIAAYWYLWPTTSIWLVPGSANLFVLAMMPQNHESTVFSGHRYGLTDTTDTERGIYLNKILGPEDQGLCESVQRGLKSQSYNQGRFMVDPSRSGIAEHGVHQFHKLVTEALAK
jgi:choline monooxygenase